MSIDDFQVPVQKLRWVCDPDSLGIKSTADLEPATEPIGRLRQPLSGPPLRQRYASSLRAAPVVTTRRKPRPASDCGVQAQVTDPSDGRPRRSRHPRLAVPADPATSGIRRASAQRSDRPGATPRTPGRRSRGRGSIGGPTRHSERHRGQGRAGRARKEEVGTRAGVVSRVRISSRFAQAIGTDRNTDLN